MKLRNKKTGEKAEVEIGHNSMLVTYENGKIEQYYFDSLKDLEEWEDYEEPKGCWIINIFGVVEYTHFRNEAEAELLKEIGNYFETEEKTEKAVKKLKAWKRLENKGFRFNKWTILEEPKTPHIKLVIEAEMDVPDSPYDLDLLFGGEE